MLDVPDCLISTVFEDVWMESKVLQRRNDNEIECTILIARKTTYGRIERDTCDDVWP